MEGGGIVDLARERVEVICSAGAICINCEDSVVHDFDSPHHNWTCGQKWGGDLGGQQPRVQTRRH